MTISEAAINFIAEGTRVEGKIHFSHVSRVNGTLVGEVYAAKGSTLILSETAVVEGKIEADTLVIDGYVRGNIIAHTKVIITSTGRVVGDIEAQSIGLEFGAYFEGKSSQIQ